MGACKGEIEHWRDASWCKLVLSALPHRSSFPLIKPESIFQGKISSNKKQENRDAAAQFGRRDKYRTKEVFLAFIAPIQYPRLEKEEPE